MIERNERQKLTYNMLLHRKYMWHKAKQKQPERTNNNSKWKLVCCDKKNIHCKKRSKKKRKSNNLIATKIVIVDVCVLNFTKHENMAKKWQPPRQYHSKCALTLKHCVCFCTQIHRCIYVYQRIKCLNPFYLKTFTNYAHEKYTQKVEIQTTRTWVWIGMLVD